MIAKFRNALILKKAPIVAGDAERTLEHLIANGAVSFGIRYDRWIGENFRIRRRLMGERSNRRMALGGRFVRPANFPA
jgi:hypothetical protein